MQLEGCMPLHDWLKADGTAYHDFHNSWIVALKDALNGGLLPGNLFARSELSVAVGASPTVRRADVGVKQHETRSVEPGGAMTVAAHPLQATFTVDLPCDAVLPKRVAVSDESGEMIAAIEIISPSNKADAARLGDFAGKCVDLIQAGIHVTAIDILPKAGRLPGFEALIEEEFTNSRTERREQGQCLVAAYQANGWGGEHTAREYLDVFTVGSELPNSALFIEVGTYISLPLEQTYGEVFGKLPTFMKRLLES